MACGDEPVHSCGGQGDATLLGFDLFYYGNLHMSSYL
jgi:hypothetical protein